MLHSPKTGLLKRIQIPDNLPRVQYDNLPKSCGVYEFKDANGRPLYIGKANNIKKTYYSTFLHTEESANTIV